MSVERAFETDSILLRDRTGLVAFDIDPTTTGFNAPIGSLGMRTNGSHYRKTGALDTDWTLTDTGGGGGGGGELAFYDRLGVADFIDIVVGQLPFFNRAGGSENIAII
ncbi:MAG: hypothetical protein ACTSX2_01335 [Candidatus Thorarchaeota archaeon]